MGAVREPTSGICHWRGDYTVHYRTEATDTVYIMLHVVNAAHFHMIILIYSKTLLDIHMTLNESNWLENNFNKMVKSNWE